MSDQVTRWTKHGKDRAYVKDGGTNVGFVDLQTGAVHVQSGADADRVWRAVSLWATASRVKLPMRKSAVIGGGTGQRVTGSIAGQQAGSSAAAASTTGGGGFFSRMFGGRKEDSWARGAAGERETGKVLAGLEPAWKAVHSVPVGVKGSDIDHVVMGPGGVFTINTKNHPRGKITVTPNSVLLDGKRTEYVDAAVFEAERASLLLSEALGVHLTVRPLIVPIAASVTVQAAPKGVFVVALPNLKDWLKRQPPALTSAQVGRVYEVASNAQTWRASR